MRPGTIVIVASAVLVASTAADAQVRRQERGTRQDIARAQGVPPGHLPPANQCRVWYDDRPNGRQPSPTDCRHAESIAARDRNARVVYGENVYRTGQYGDNRGYRGYPAPDDDRAVRRGRVRDPRVRGGVLDDGRSDRYGGRYEDRYLSSSPAYQNGYRDGLTKGREDAEDGDRYDVNRHGWYRSANRGFESRDGNRRQYEAVYRDAFEAGYAEGYRVYARR